MPDGKIAVHFFFFRLQFRPSRKVENSPEPWMRRCFGERRKRRALQQVFLRDGKRSWIVMAEEIRLLESVGNYTRVHFADNSPLICKSLNALEHQLDPALFFRASRSHIINLRAVKSLDEESRGGLVATLIGGCEVTMTRR